MIGVAVTGVLLALLRKTTAPAGLARRARVILLLVSGYSGVDTAQKVGMSPRHVHKWGQRFRERGLAGLEDKPRPGRKPKFQPGVALHLVQLAYRTFQIDERTEKQRTQGGQRMTTASGSSPACRKRSNRPCCCYRYLYQGRGLPHT